MKDISDVVGVVVRSAEHCGRNWIVSLSREEPFRVTHVGFPSGTEVGLNFNSS